MLAGLIVLASMALAHGPSAHGEAERVELTRDQPVKVRFGETEVYLVREISHVLLRDAEGSTLAKLPISPHDRVRELHLDGPIRDRYRVSSGFGYRHHPVLKQRRFHNGIDLAVPTGTDVFAPADGEIVVIDENAISGRYVTLDHGDGIRTSYAHLNALPAVPLGTEVRRGQRFAQTGNTGRSTGPHLHYMVLVDGTPIDPAPHLPKPESDAVAMRD
ncbi:MAG: M23 family metallopeptidase [Deltaproteobacteria bacterium]|nr:MAG: M23 family metallopeptidase [Deltaproteobacteria bacterium]